MGLLLESNAEYEVAYLHIRFRTKISYIKPINAPTVPLVLLPICHQGRGRVRA